MKTKLFFLLVALLFFINIYSQIDLNEQVIVSIDYVTYNTSFTESTDINGDGFPDVIASGSDLNWYENLDGLGSFG